MTTNNSITAAINQNKKLTPVRVEQVSAASLGFSNIDNTRDINKPVSTAQQAALDLKANIESPTFTGTVSGITSTMVGLGNVTNESKTTIFTNSALTGIPTAPTADSPTNTTQIATTQFVQTRVTTKINELIGDAGTTLDSLGELADALNDSPAIITNLKSQLTAHESRTDNPHNVTASLIGLGNVTNESKATMFSNPTFTGTVSGVTKSMVGLGNVENKTSATIRGEIVDSDIPSTITRDTELQTFTGSANITTVGTIGTGTWQGTAIETTYIGNLPANKITSGTFTDSLIPNLATSKITSGVFSSPRLPNRTAGDITTGVFHADRIPNNLPTSKINSGVFDSPRIPRLSIHAVKITEGTIDDARIPSSIARDSELSAHTNSTSNPHSVTKAQVGLGSVDNTSDQDKPISTSQQTALDAKAPTANPTFTGTVSGVTKAMVGLSQVSNQSPAELFASAGLTGNPTAPTQTASDNTTKIATTEYVTSAVASLIDSAPGSLNTLNELAEALNDSPSQIDNILASVGQRLVIGNNLSDLNNASTARTNLGLGNVEDTAISTFAGSSNITTVGTISTGTWQGTAIANAYVADLPTSKITSGTFADARIASSNVTQHSGDITSVGTLTSLTTSGNLTADGTDHRLNIGTNTRFQVLDALVKALTSFSVNGTLYTFGNNELGNQTTDTTIVSGDFTAGSSGATAANKLFFDTSTGRLGIGTTSPDTALDVNGDITLTQGAARTIKIARATVAENGDNLTIESGKYKSGTEGNGGDLTLKAGNGDSSDGNGGNLILSAGSGDTSGVIKFSGTEFLFTSGSSAQLAFRNAIGAGTGTYSDGSIINTNQVTAHANSTLFIRGKTGPTAYPVNITGGSKDGDSGSGAGVTIAGGTSGSNTGNGGDVTIQGGSGETTHGKVTLGGSNTLQIDVNSIVNMSGDLTVDTDTLKVDTTNNRVGINTIPTFNALEVNGDIKAAGVLKSSSSAPGLFLTDTDGTNLLTSVFNTNGVTIIQARNNNNNGIIDFRQNNGTTDPTTPMRIDSNGRVGIGTTSPSQELEVAGNIKASGTIQSTSYEAADFPNTTSVRTTAAFKEDGTLVQDEKVIVFKLTGTQMATLTSTNDFSGYYEILPAQGVGKVIVPRELELYISFPSGSGHTVPNFQNDFQIIMPTPSTIGTLMGQSSRVSTFGTIKKNVLNMTYANSGDRHLVDTVYVRDAPSVAGRAFPNTALYLRPKQSYVGTHPASDYTFRLTYKLIDLSTDFAVTTT
jgi:hypothetical protein